MRAREPDRDGFADHDGTRVFYEVFGAGEPTLVLVPSNPIIYSRQWKAQVPYLSRHYRVVTFDGRGNGRSDRPVAPEAYTEEAYLAELAAVLDATGSDPVVLVGLCHDGVWRSLRFAADHPERVAGIVAISVGVPLIAPPHPFKLEDRFDEELDTDQGWARRNRTPGGATTAGSSSSSSPRCFPSPTRPSRSRTAWPRAWRPAWRRCWPRWTPASSCRETRWRRSAGGSGRRC